MNLLEKVKLIKGMNKKLSELQTSSLNLPGKIKLIKELNSLYKQLTSDIGTETNFKSPLLQELVTEKKFKGQDIFTMKPNDFIDALKEICDEIDQMGDKFDDVKPPVIKYVEHYKQAA